MLAASATPSATLMAGSRNVAKNSLGVHAADAMLLEQFLDRRLAQLARFGRRRRDSPQIENPRRRQAVGDLLHLRIVPPQLLMHAVAQPNAFLRQFLGKARPRAQLDQPRVGDMHAAEQTPVGAHAIAHHVGVPTVILRTGHAVPVAQAVELLRIDRVHDKSAIDQGIDYRAVRHLDPHRHRVWPPRNRQQPVAKVSQALATMRKLPLSDDAALCIDKTRLMSLRAPVDAGKPRKVLLGHRILPTNARAATMPAVPVPGAQGATSYWASVVANPPGHMSNRGASSTGISLVAPAGPARPVRLRQCPIRRCEGYRYYCVALGDGHLIAFSTEFQVLGGIVVVKDQGGPITTVPGVAIWQSPQGGTPSAIVSNGLLDAIGYTFDPAQGFAETFHVHDTRRTTASGRLVLPGGHSVVGTTDLSGDPSYPRKAGRVTFAGPNLVALSDLNENPNFFPGIDAIPARLADGRIVFVGRSGRVSVLARLPGQPVPVDQDPPGWWGDGESVASAAASCTYFYVASAGAFTTFDLRTLQPIASVPW